MPAIWEGSIAFGLVEIPVMLRPAEEPSDDFAFTQLDRRDLSPVGYKRYNKKTGKEVAWEDIVRGYEYEDGRYVLLSPEEIEAAHPKLTKTVEILQFVDRNEIDPLYFDKPYYLEPRRKGSKSYALLRETLERTGKVAIARVVIRTRQYLAAVSPRGKVLVLNLLRYPHELRDPKDLDLPAEEGRARPTAAEIRMAEQLVRGMTGKWKPEEYHDEYRDQVLALVREKVKRGKIERIAEPEAREQRGGKVIDLMDMLKESIERNRGGRASRSSSAAAPARVAARRAPRSARARKNGRATRRSA